MLKILDILALLFLCGTIFWLSDQSKLPMPMVFELQDKLHHFIAYFVMGILAWRSFRYFVTPPVLAIISVAFCSLYGISDEWHQSFVVGRTSETLDWVADTLGAAVAMLLVPRFQSYLKFINVTRGKTIQNS
jgi:VanZ family protein